MPNGRNGEIRLMGKGGVDSNEGRLEIYHNGEWGTVCWDGIHTNSLGKVVCRIKGFADGTVDITDNPGTGKIWMSNVACVGNEFSLLDCPHHGWGVFGLCNHILDVEITCA